MSWEEGAISHPFIGDNTGNAGSATSDGQLRCSGQKKRPRFGDTHPNLPPVHDEALLFPKFICGKLLGTRLWFKATTTHLGCRRRNPKRSGKESHPACHLGKPVFKHLRSCQGSRLWLSIFPRVTIPQDENQCCALGGESEPAAKTRP